MKKNSILIVGLGVPSELTDVLMREGCDILRSETPLQAALVLLIYCTIVWLCLIFLYIAQINGLKIITAPILNIRSA